MENGDNIGGGFVTALIVVAFMVVMALVANQFHLMPIVNLGFMI